MADPGFPVEGGVDFKGGLDSRDGYVFQIVYVKTKESGSLGGRAPGTPPLDPPMVTPTIVQKTFSKFLFLSF